MPASFTVRHDVTDPLRVIPYTELPASHQAKIEEVVHKHVIDSEGEVAVLTALKEFGEDGALILSVIGTNVRKGKLMAGIWEEVFSIMRVGEASPAEFEVPLSSTQTISVEMPKPKKEVKEDVPVAKSNLPFDRASLKSEETMESFLDRWRKKKKTYPDDMIDWSTGEINWNAPVVYGFRSGTISRAVYQALVESPCTYSDILELAVAANIKRRDVDDALKKIMVEPCWLPPGAGVYCEDAETGLMWIHRELPDALRDTLPYKSSK